jgi:hypothetical protein
MAVQQQKHWGRNDRAGEGLRTLLLYLAVGQWDRDTDGNLARLTKQKRRRQGAASLLSLPNLRWQNATGAQPAYAGSSLQYATSS